MDVKVGDTLKVGILNGSRFLTEIIDILEHSILLKPVKEEPIPAKLPVTLIVALPRPKVLRRLIMDAVTMGVQKLVAGAESQGNKIHVSWLTSVMKVSTRGLPSGLA